MKLTLTILVLLTTALAQETTSSSTLHIPGPMEQSITQLSGTRDASTTSTASDDSSSTSSHYSVQGPMEQSVTTSATDSSSTAAASSTTDMTSSPTTATASESSSSTGNDATRTGVSQSQGSSAAEALLGRMKLEQMVMMGLGVGAALVV